MTTSPWYLIGALAFAAAACGSDAPVGPALDGETALAAASVQSESGPETVEVPFEATGEGIGTAADPEPPCDEGFTATGNVAHGTATHLGEFTSVHRQCVNFQTLEFRDGTVTYHAANGDQLHATFEGFLTPTAEPGVLSFDNPAHPAGGTGRFEGADGLFRARGLVDLNDNTFEIHVEGVLVLPR